MSIRVLIADDYAPVRNGLRRLIGKGGECTVVSEVSGGEEVLVEARKHPVDVFILDIMMPGLNGIAVVTELIRIDPAAKILILSCTDSKALIDETIAAGALGYLTKSAATRKVLVDAIVEVNAGRRFYFGALESVLVEPVQGQLDQVRVAAMPGTFREMTETLEKAKERIAKLQEQYDLLSQTFLARGTGDLTQLAGDLAGRTSYKEAPPIVAGDIRYELTLRERVEQTLTATPMSVQEIADALDESVGRVAAVIRILKTEGVLHNRGGIDNPAWTIVNPPRRRTVTPIRGRGTGK